ncbi:MAG: DUF1178 family protein [Alphaproteobacteria bacterium]|nr:DUF1178 family protein [Alphaproteobacteria bacterium]
MIAYDLRCKRDHVFEAWFRDSAAYDEQRAKRTVTCPVCGSAEIEKALMTPNVAVRKHAADERKAMSDGLRRLRALRRHIESHFDDVGDRFAEEARKIHYGESQRKSIYGNATREESRELADEGIEVRQIPWVPAHDS